MFNKIFTSFVLFIFISVGFIHSSIMTFAVSNHIKQNNSNLVVKHDKKYKKCIKKILISDYIKSTCNSIGIIPIKILSFNFINKFLLESSTIKNREIIKIHSPPNYKRRIKLYSYIDLTKIIKSNN